MRSLFRNLRKGVVNDQKIKRYLLYAIGELFLVVIGILIALEINEWNNSNNDRKKEASILKQIHVESSGNLDQFIANKKGHIASMEASNIVLRNVRHLEEEASLDSALSYTPFIFRGITFDPSVGFAESLISTGDIQLIRNDSLRHYLITWKNVLEDFKEEEGNMQFLWRHQVEPYLVEKGDFLDPASSKNIELLKDPVFLNMIARKQFYVSSMLYSKEMIMIEEHIRTIVRLSKDGRLEN